jgi:hypothetical protein
MARVKIVVSVINPIGSPPTNRPFPPAGDYFDFTEDVVLKRYKRKRPGHGLPSKQEDRFAGVHSGTMTFLRITGPGDRFYKPDIIVWQYVATYKFNNLPKTPLKKGQITGDGLLLFDTTSHTVVEQPSKYAITGGTDAYARARGEIRELHNPSNDRELRIVL